MPMFAATYPKTAPAPAPDERVCRALVRATLRLYTLVCMPAVRVRAEAAWPDGPKLIALNHANGSDGFALPFIFSDPLVAVAQADLFQVPVLGRWMAGAGWVPLAPGQGQAALAAARRQLEQGRSVVICPEGRLNHGGPLLRGKIGAARLALETGVPIVPVGCYVPPRYTRVIQGNKAGRSTSGRWQIGGALYVEIGAPLWGLQPEDGADGQPTPRQLTDRLMGKIGSLVAQAQARAEQ